MKRKQAEKLYCAFDGEKTFVLYVGTAYVADVESGSIIEEDGKLIYSDSAVCDIDVEEADVSDFAIYRKTEKWWK